VRGVITGMRRYFGKAWIWGAVNLLSIVIVYVNVVFYQQWDSPVAPFFQTVVIMLAVMWYLTQFYALPFFMELKEPNVWTALRNGFFMMMASPFYAFALLILVVVLLAASIIFVLPFFLGLPMIIPILGGRAVQDRLVTFGLRKKDVDPREVR
jgi:uncharacterized membrane protein YesL